MLGNPLEGVAVTLTLITNCVEEPVSVLVIVELLMLISLSSVVLIGTT